MSFNKEGRKYRFLNVGRVLNIGEFRFIDKLDTMVAIPFAQEFGIGMFIGIRLCFVSLTRYQKEMRDVWEPLLTQGSFVGNDVNSWDISNLLSR